MDVLHESMLAAEGKDGSINAITAFYLGASYFGQQLYVNDCN